MGCGCKKNEPVDLTPKGISNNIGKTSLNLLVFIIFVITLPIVNLIIIWMGFKAIVLRQQIDFKGILMLLANKFSNKKDDDDDDDDYYENVNDKDVYLTNVEVLSKSK